MKPVWLLDIDDVINAGIGRNDRFPVNIWPSRDWIDTKALSSRTFRIVAARPVLNFIRKVHEAGRVEIRWHTTWQHNARNVATALDLPHFPVQDAPEFARVAEELRHDRWWKLPAAWRVVRDEGRSLIWTDDHLTCLRPHQVTSLSAAGDVLLIAPDPGCGLTKGDLEDIELFLKKTEETGQ